jgi:hypothetical protein
LASISVRPPQAVPLGVDERSHRIQNRSGAADAGQTARRSHDDTRHGMTSLFAALDIATGQVIGKCFAPSRDQVP